VTFGKVPSENEKGYLQLEYFSPRTILLWWNTYNSQSHTITYNTCNIYSNNECTARYDTAIH